MITEDIRYINRCLMEAKLGWIGVYVTNRFFKACNPDVPAMLMLDSRFDDSIESQLLPYELIARNVGEY